MTSGGRRLPGLARLLQLENLRTRGAAAPLAVAAAGAPLLLAPSHLDDLARVAATDAIFAVACFVVLGLAGQFSLGQAALYGVGAYAAAILTVRYQWDPLLALPAAMAAGAAAGLLLGLPSLRVSGDQLAVLTLAMGLAAQLLFLNWTPVTGGFGGIPGVPAPRLWGTVLADDRSLYVLALILLVAVVGGVEVVRRTRLGRAMRAVQDDEIQAAVLGIHVGVTKLVAFALSGAIAAVAGWLYAVSLGYVSSPGFGITLSVLGVVMVLIAGSGRLYATVLAGAALALMDTLTQNLPQVELGLLGFAMLGAMLWRGRPGQVSNPL
ncbi:MAG: branched-chain amino acid ABC transporter permease [Candidatus Dormibacteria bacterium]